MQEKEIAQNIVRESLFSSESLNIERFLNPISAEHPCGEYLLYEGTYDKIQEARREDDLIAARGVWERSLKKADWNQVRELCCDALEHKSKDLQIAGWLLESLLSPEYAFAGVRDGLNLILGLCERFWDTLHPEISADDIDSRIAPIFWINEKLSLKLKLIPMTMPQTSPDAVSYAFKDWEDAEESEKLASKNKKLYEQAVSGGKITRAKFLGSVMFTPVSFYNAQSQALNAAMSSLLTLERVLDIRCGKASPGLKQFKDILENIQRLSDTFLEEKLEKERQDNSVSPEIKEAYESGEDRMMRISSITIRNRADAYRILSAAADYLMIHEPHSPAPYLVKRAVSWGNMTLTDLLKELVSDQKDLTQILQLLGLKGLS